MQAKPLSRLLDPAPSLHILVLGDLMLDQYVVGDAERVSQEAPILVLRDQEHRFLLGGAANVAHMLRGLEVAVTTAGVVGADATGDQARQMLEDAGVDSRCVVTDDSRPTTLKTRFVGRSHGRHGSQLLRVDREDSRPLPTQLWQSCLSKILEEIDRYDAILISDYGKGACVGGLLQGVIRAARERRIPVLVDPARQADFGRYQGSTLIKPNRTETSAAVGYAIDSTERAIAAACQLCRDYAIEMAVVTLDRDGMALATATGESQCFATRARAVYDITGAGDMVLAAIGRGLAAGGTPAEAIQLANVAAGLEVEREGVAVIPASEIRDALQATRPVKQVTREQAAEAARRAQREGKRVVFTNGCFDLLHAGHVRSLNEAAAFGDLLIVGVNDDHRIQELKGPQRPIIGQDERVAVLAALECVDHVLLFSEPTPHVALEAIRPDVLVKGGTYREDEVVGHEIVKRYGGSVRVTGVVDGLSTTDIVARVRAA